MTTVWPFPIDRPGEQKVYKPLVVDDNNLQMLESIVNGWIKESVRDNLSINEK